MKVFLIRLLIGPASIADGVAETLTCGFISPRLKMFVATKLTKSENEMTKILIDEEVVKQALDTLENLHGSYNEDGGTILLDEDITALRSALDAAKKVEPVAEVCDDQGLYVHWIKEERFYERYPVGTIFYSLEGIKAAVNLKGET